MRKIGVDECLVMWMLDFMTKRRVHMVVDGQEGQELVVTTGLPQGSPASPILFAIHMYDLQVRGKVVPGGYKLLFRG
jgi:hypothetical protein